MKVNMKKWMMTLSMCFVAAATAMSVSAVTPSVVGGAEVPVEYIWVGNVKIEDGQYLKAGETSASFEAQTDNYAHYENDVLTLKNYTYTGEGAYDVGGYETYDAIHCRRDQRDFVAG